MRGKTFFSMIAVLALMAISCQNSNKGDKASVSEETLVLQCVERMMVSDVDQILSEDMLALQNRAKSVHYDGYYYWGFEWNTGVFDVCSEDADAKIEGVHLRDSLHCDVDIRYVDEGCYDIPYTLNLLKEQGQWKIDEVVYHDGQDSHTLRGDCEAFYEDVAEMYATNPANEVMDFLLGEEPTEESYTEPGTIFFNNPQAVKSYADELRNCLELFKNNPDYTDEMGQRIEAMIAHIEGHL